MDPPGPAGEASGPGGVSGVESCVVRGGTPASTPGPMPPAGPMPPSEAARASQSRGSALPPSTGGSAAMRRTRTGRRPGAGGRDRATPGGGVEAVEGLSRGVVAAAGLRVPSGAVSVEPPRRGPTARPAWSRATPAAPVGATRSVSARTSRRLRKGDGPSVARRPRGVVEDHDPGHPRRGVRPVVPRDRRGTALPAFLLGHRRRPQVGDLARGEVVDLPWREPQAPAQLEGDGRKLQGVVGVRLTIRPARIVEPGNERRDDLVIRLARLPSRGARGRDGPDPEPGPQPGEPGEGGLLAPAQTAHPHGGLTAGRGADHGGPGGHVHVERPPGVPTDDLAAPVRPDPHAQPGGHSSRILVALNW